MAESLSNLDGRVYIYPRDLRGQWADAAYVYEKAGVLRQVGPLQSLVIRDRLIARGEEHEAVRPKGRASAELDALLPMLSLMSAQERLTQKSEPMLRSCVREVRELVASASESLGPEYVQLALEVLREAEGDKTAGSLALDIHNHFSTRQAGPLFMGWLEAQASTVLLAK